MVTGPQSPHPAHRLSWDLFRTRPEHGRKPLNNRGEIDPFTPPRCYPILTFPLKPVGGELVISHPQDVEEGVSDEVVPMYQKV